MFGKKADVVLTDVRKSFGKLVAVKGASFRVRSGEFLTLLGPSGCGKTTTLRMIAGLERPDSGEIRVGETAVHVFIEELGFAVDIGDIQLTECQMINQFAGIGDQPPQFTRGYGVAFGQSERKAMSMAIVDRSLKARELGEPAEYPAQQEEFVLYHSDNIEASGFVEHLKLPHYVDFQGELELLRKIRREREVATAETRARAEREAAE